MDLISTYLLLFAALILRTSAQVPPLETKDFNLTQALIDRRVNLTDLPISEGSSLSLQASCTITCNTLKVLYGSDQVYLHGSPELQTFRGGYWSKQQMLAEPHCVFFPSSASEVSTFILLSRLTRCPFSTKSGGHAAMSGASNSEGGITLALQNMNEVTLSTDKKIASIGPGNLWNRVYSILAEKGVAVVGGRVANIGVGGLITGGGISFYSNKYGWACDNVESYEVVTANGDIIIANEKSHSDLYWALRGGGNNFGIVTKFNLFAHKQGQMYGGSMVFKPENYPAMLEGYHDYATRSEEDPDAASWVAVGRFNGDSLAVVEVAYAKNETSPAIFSKYLNASSAHDGRTSRTLTEHTFEIQKSTPNGHREAFHHITTKMTPEFTAWTIDVWYEEIEAIKDVAGIVLPYVLHPVTIPQLKNMAKRGGNALGLDDSDGVLEMHHASIMWDNEEDDLAIFEVINNFYNRIEARAKELGILKDFIYMNYASLFQDPIASYGAANKARLQEIATKYDPSGVFQVLHPGYFKLKGGPYQDYAHWLSQKSTPKVHDEL